eukprot:CAMPEP_0178989638 /NCGR_PEP_ID=MMETSP0795-20121207/4491_1 /TAXON_ID=88552 /ORGANISM="Amoebophrya sp., Strain Ameob2" /LENGTH=121 /DNA_ID=CAMNT_0020681073 /DNA_START=189 /DNA_END=555 /DNA_ORIENTATION=-
MQASGHRRCLALLQQISVVIALRWVTLRHALLEPVTLAMQRSGAAGAAGAASCGAPSFRCTTSVCRGPIIASTARFATDIPTPAAMPEAMLPARPDIMPPPAAGAAGGGAAYAGAGGGGAA